MERTTLNECASAFGDALAQPASTFLTASARRGYVAPAQRVLELGGDSDFAAGIETGGNIFTGSQGSASIDIDPFKDDDDPWNDSNTRGYAYEWGESP